MEKNNREKYFEAWLLFLKGRNQIDPKALAESLSGNLKGALSPTTMKRYNATVIANLYENGFLFGKPGKPLEIVQEITLPILDKSLTANYKKIKFAEIEKATAPAEPAPEAPTAKKPKTVKKEKKVKKTKVVAETPRKKPARKRAKPKAKRAAKPGPKKVFEAKAEKPTGRKPGLKKKVAEKPKKAVAAKAKKAPGRKPGRTPRKKTGPKGAGLVGRKADLLRMGESAFLYSLDLQRQIEEMERVIANYERMFEAVRGLFSREMEEIEELVAGLLE